TIFSDGPELDVVGKGDFIIGEFADTESGPLTRHRRNNCGNTRAIRQTRIQTRGLIINTTTHTLCNAVYSGTEIILAGERLRNTLQLSFAFHENFFVTIDEDLGNTFVVQILQDRTEILLNGLFENV